ncbi:GNAT family N-acetyltransferase [Chryseobacterium sp. Marseille-Q3244]|uniref:GNAT family N-acetyltransferase n=1 Tax=Chryseobacterium sp. Marseille-Q3244 TaxID=2758092 RepID=UPI002024E66D|nr:GNAT family N-acetyltransferase [Chryseobacterium sp. Marseille-Q3244]
MYRFEVIDKLQPEWNQIVKASSAYDFHHTAFYHTIDNGFDSKLFVAYEDDVFVALPLVIRPIEETGFYDCTSVYGYAGPISNIKDFNFSSDLKEFFKKEFDRYCIENSIVCAFSRLHPLIDQDHFFENFGKILNVNKTISIDLTLPIDQQRALYGKSNKSQINQLRRNGFTVEEAKTSADFDAFVEIYYETMHRVNALPSYFFTKEYFHAFLNNNDFDSKLLLAKHEGKIVAGGIFTMTNNIMQYHLSGTTGEYLRNTPMKLLLDEARLLGNEYKMAALHLGGGAGGSDEDSLFLFKASFSKTQCMFKVWQYIIDLETYNKLSESVTDKNSGFFPLYRSKN